MFPFPFVSNITYTSVQDTGNQSFVLPLVYTSPRHRVEAEPSFGVYKQWKTTFKLDPVLWAQAVGTVGGLAQIVATGTYAGTYTWNGTSYQNGSYYLDFTDGYAWQIVGPGPTVVDGGTGWSTGSAGTTITASTADLALYPRLRDYLVVAGETWVVYRDVDSPDPIGGLWRLCCNRLEIDLKLDHQIRLGTAVDGTDAYTSPITSVVYEAPQPAAIQEVLKEQVVHNNKQGFRYHYHIWVYGEPRLAYGSLIKDERGYIYQVEAQIDRNRIDELCCIRCWINP